MHLKREIWYIDDKDREGLPMHTILICDDDRDIVSALKIYLTSEGYQTVEAYNGEEAVAPCAAGTLT